jgi:hypothetical protein
MLPWLVGVTVALFMAIMYIPQSFYSGFSFGSYPQRHFSMPICLGMYLVFYLRYVHEHNGCAEGDHSG